LLLAALVGVSPGRAAFFKNLSAMSIHTKKERTENLLDFYRLADFIKILDTLTEREKTILIRCDFDLQTNVVVGKEVGITAARVSQIAYKARRRVATALLNYRRFKEEFENLQVENRLLELRAVRAEKILADQNKPIQTVKEVEALKIEHLDMSVRLYNAIKPRANIVGQIKDIGNECLKWRTFGRKTYIELRELMESIGIKWPVNEPQIY